MFKSECINCASMEGLMKNGATDLQIINKSAIIFKYSCYSRNRLKFGYSFVFTQIHEYLNIITVFVYFEISSFSLCEIALFQIKIL